MSEGQNTMSRTEAYLMAEVRRDLDFVVDIIRMMEALNLTDTVQYARALDRRVALQKAVFKAKGGAA